MQNFTFKEGLNEHDKLIVGPGSENENNGYFSSVRVDRNTLPEGWFAYDFRRNNIGELRTIEKGYVTDNYGGTFLTQNQIRFPKDKYGKEKDWMTLPECGGYVFP